MSPEALDSYSLLGLDSSASNADIRQAYKKVGPWFGPVKLFKQSNTCVILDFSTSLLCLGKVAKAALRWHPDKNPQAHEGPICHASLTMVPACP